MKIDNEGRVISFSEKPRGNELKAMVIVNKSTNLICCLRFEGTHLICYMLQAVDTTVLGLSQEEAKKKPYIASMGVYVFKKEILLNLLR